MKVALCGMPNAGKTTLFNQLTKSHLAVGNYHGVTTHATQKTKGEQVWIDCPGFYSFTTQTMEEREASQVVQTCDVIVQVIDVFVMEQSLRLSQELSMLGKPMILYLTKCKQFRRRGGTLKIEEFSRAIGVPVVATAKQLTEALVHAGKFRMPKGEYAHLPKQSLGRVERLFYRPLFALPIFLLTIVGMFAMAFQKGLIGDLCKRGLEWLIFDCLSNWCSQVVHNSVAQSFVVEGICGGVGTVLTFLPQIVILYTFLILLDESGILSALTFVTDGLFEKLKLSGRSAFSLISGFGCTTSAILTTQGYENKTTQRRTIFLLGYIPCGAKMPVLYAFLAPLFPNPFPVLTALYLATILLGLLCSRLYGKRGENFLAEVTPIQIPSLKIVCLRLLNSVKSFLTKIATVLFLFSVFSWLLSHFNVRLQYGAVEDSMLHSIASILTPLFAPMGVKDWQLCYSALMGFFAKENVLVALSQLYEPLPTVGYGFIVFVLLSPVCFSALSVAVKEVGKRFALQCYILQFLIALLGGYLTNLICLL